MTEILFVIAAIWFVVALVANLRRRAARKAAEVVHWSLDPHSGMVVPCGMAKVGEAGILSDDLEEVTCPGCLDLARRLAEGEPTPEFPGSIPRRKSRKKRNTADWPDLLDREDVLVVDVETTGVGGRAEVVGRHERQCLLLVLTLALNCRPLGDFSGTDSALLRLNEKAMR